MEPSPQQILGGTWRLDLKLGEGGLATVHAATHVRTGARVAVKILKARHADDEDVRARFGREAYVANSIPHPGVVKVLGDGVDDGRVYLVMELVEGESLKARWVAAGRRLPLEEVAGVVTALLDVLAAAHAAGVVHRDVKPDNVLIDARGRVRLVDFGVARITSPGAAAGGTMTGVLLGTPAFMSPEQALARWKEVDARTDLFAVAATAWTLLSGRLVHPGATVPELLIAAATKPVAPIRSVLPELPASIAEVLDGALQFERGMRPADATAMREAWTRAIDAAARRAPLRTILSSEPPPPTPAVWPTPAPLGAEPVLPAPATAPRKVLGARRWLAICAVALAMMGGAVTATVLLLSSEAPRRSTKRAKAPPTTSAPKTNAGGPVASATPPPRADVPPTVALLPKDIEDVARRALAKFGADVDVVQLSWTEYASAIQFATPNARGGTHMQAYGWHSTQTEFTPSSEFDLPAGARGETFKLSALDWPKLRAILEDARARTRLEFAGPNHVVSAKISTGAGMPELFVTVQAGTHVSDHRFDLKGNPR